MPKHKQGVVSVDKIMGAGRERSDADREHEAGRAGGVFAHTHLWVRHNTASLDLPQGNPHQILMAQNEEKNEGAPTTQPAGGMPYCVLF